MPVVLGLRGLPCILGPASARPTVSRHSVAAARVLPASVAHTTAPVGDTLPAVDRHRGDAVPGGVRHPLRRGATLPRVRAPYSLSRSMPAAAAVGRLAD